MDVYLEPAPWPGPARDPHLLFAAGLLVLAGYLLLVLVLAFVEPAAVPAPVVDRDRRVPVRIQTRTAAERAEPAEAVAEVDPAAANDAVTPSPAPAIRSTPDPATGTPPDAPKHAGQPRAAAGTDTGRPLDLALPEPEPGTRMPPVCRAGPCAPGTATLPRIRPARRPADEVLADLDPEVLERLDLEALGIDPDLGDIYGERRVALNRFCDLVKPENNVVTRQMGMPQFLRCRRTSASKARAQALLDALREKRPDLFENP